MPYGVAKSKLIPCARSQHHGFHPEGEWCRFCDVPITAVPVGKSLGRRYYEYGENSYFGVISVPWESLAEFDHNYWESMALSAIAKWGTEHCPWHPLYGEQKT
jgi:hypothetical protein